MKKQMIATKVMEMMLKVMKSLSVLITHVEVWSGSNFQVGHDFLKNIG